MSTTEETVLEILIKILVLYSHQFLCEIYLSKKLFYRTYFDRLYGVLVANGNS